VRKHDHLLICLFDYSKILGHTQLGEEGTGNPIIIGYSSVIGYNVSRNIMGLFTICDVDIRPKENRTHFV